MPVSRTSQNRETSGKDKNKSPDRTSSPKQTTSDPEPAADSKKPTAELSSGSVFGQNTFDQHVALLGDSRMSRPMYPRQGAAIVRQIQRQYGNRYVQRVVDHIQSKRSEGVQAKLTVGPAGDKYEQEADRVAKQVVGMTEPSAQRQEEEMLQAKPDGSAQRQGELEQEELQMKPLVQRKPMEDQEREHFIEWVLPKFTDLQWTTYNEDKDRWLKFKVKGFRNIYVETYDKKGIELEPNDYTPIKKAIDSYYEESSGLKGGVKLDTVVQEWGKMNLNDFYKKLEMPNLKEPPTVYYAPSRSAGHYEPKKNRIYIDPIRNTTPQQKLETLEFEVLNAGDRPARLAITASGESPRKKAWMSIELEFNTSKREIQKILRAHKANDYKDLVTIIGISDEIIGEYPPCPYPGDDMIEDVRVPRPDVSELKNKDRRTALFWYQVGNWRDDQIINEYAYSEHTPGGGISTLDQQIKEYEKSTKVVQ